MNGSRRRLRPLSYVFALAILLSTVSGAYAAALPEKLTPMGIPAGIRSGTDGVTVAGILDAEISPAAKAGLRPGDVLLTLNGTPLRSAAELTRNLTQDVPAELTLRRDGEILSLTVTPQADEDGDGCRIGVWLRDSLLGIGTLTFYDPDTGLFGALGHGVSVPNGKKLVDLTDGSIIPAQVVSVHRGIAGKPGELVGNFEPENPMGTCDRNTPCGVFGIMEEAVEGKALPTARLEQVKAGDAEILTCVDGETPETYRIRIIRVEPEQPEGRNFLIEVTDERLLQKTGGIVQGMSGSPILQDGKLIGAVTHVMVNAPNRGYGVGIENMLALAG